MYSLAKETKKYGCQKINNDVLVNAGLKLLGKTIKKGI